VKTFSDWPSASRLLFAALSVAVLPVLHFPGLYQRAVPENTQLALNRRGRECRHSGTFRLPFGTAGIHSRDTPLTAVADNMSG
jgi:hypothetical protein